MSHVIDTLAIVEVIQTVFITAVLLVLFANVQFFHLTHLVVEVRTGYLSMICVGNIRYVVYIYIIYGF